MSEALLRLLQRRIAATGPIPVADFMAEAMLHPRHGYYVRDDPLGRGGDFVTAPEISQMFGELIGLWAAVVWQQSGQPGNVILAEFGPGRGSLLRDALRAGRTVPGFLKAIDIHLIEINETLQARQREALTGHPVHWHSGLDTVPDGPAIFIANEFLDALPVHQLQRTAAGWCDRRVGLDPAAGALAWTVAPGPSPLAALLEAGFRDAAPPGSIAEVSPPVLGLVRALASRVVRWGGAALIVDYGYADPIAGPTLQAVRRHGRVEVLDRPGENDLSAQVDFGAVARAAVEAGARVHGPVCQGAFLRALGIEARAEALAHRAEDAQGQSIAAELHRLIDAEEMGTLFKVVAFTGKQAPTPPGFEPDC